MLLLGIDMGTSSVKVAVVDAATQGLKGMAQYPETESAIITMQPGWAEQSPDTWWEHVQMAIRKLHAQAQYDPRDIAAIGISYQMHGLVMVDKEQNVLRDSIIWCDSRAVKTGEKAFNKIGKKRSLRHLLNSPGNFTASKLAWVKKNEPGVYAKADKIMLPGDFIAMKMTGNITTSISALSEGIFWDFKKEELSKDIMDHFDFSESLIPEIKDVFETHGQLSTAAANLLTLKTGIPVTYKAGDQPNNALSLNVLEPGEVAATAGTSGVIYAVTDQLTYDKGSRVNSFAHVNYTPREKRIGVLLCINGTGIMNRWAKDLAGGTLNYSQMNESAATVEPGSDGLMIFPFGNGAERILNNRQVYAQIRNIDLTRHSSSHLFRATQEGIAFAFRYGFDLLKENGIKPKLIRAGMANMFLSEVFTRSFVNTLNVPVELYTSDGSTGAALGAGIGAKIFAEPKEAFQHFKPASLVEPVETGTYNNMYGGWLEELERQLN